MICFRLLDAKDPAQPLADAVHALAQGAATQDTYAVDPVSFRHVPNAPFAYWVSDTIRKLFTTLPPFEKEERTAKVGLQTSDDFRFVRCSWETPITPEELTQRNWYHFAKGGSYSPFYADIHLKVNWSYNNGREIKAWAGSLYNNSHWSRIIKSTDYYFRPGLTWPLRGARFSAQAVPSNCIFSVAGKMAMCLTQCENKVIHGLFNSTIFDYLIRISAGSVGGVQYEAGLIASIPTPEYKDYEEKLEMKSALASKAKMRPDTANANSHAFVAPALAPGRSNSALSN